MSPRPPTSTLFPYTTLFRSHDVQERLRFPGSGAAEDVDELLAAGDFIEAFQYRAAEDRKSTRLNSSHPSISYAVFCLKKKTKATRGYPPSRRTGGRRLRPRP